MGATEADLGKLGPLLNHGKFDDLRVQLQRIWPLDARWDLQDVQYLTLFLKIAPNKDARRAFTLYQVYEKRLKYDDQNDLEWLMSTPDRVEVIWTYEGDQAALAWLKNTRAHVYYPPNAGILDLMEGRVLLSQNRVKEARKVLSSAAHLSIEGMEWYRLEALQEMSFCLARLSENRLSFEYARTHSIESFKLGRVKQNELVSALYVLSLVYGEIDYLAEIKRNMARLLREQGKVSHAAIEMSDAAFRLGEIGAREEAARDFDQAHDDAIDGPYPTDPHFAVTCKLLGMYLDPEPPDLWVFDPTFDMLAGVLSWNRRAAQAATAMQRELRQMRFRPGQPVDDHLVKEWAEICSQYGQDRRLATERSMGLLVFVSVAALLGRYFLLVGQEAAALRLFNGILSAPDNREAVFCFVRNDLAETLLQRGQYQQALPLAQQALNFAGFLTHERFLARQQVARCLAGMGRRQEAYQMARQALSDWRRVLDGLYQESHKVAWLEKGAACIACAIQSIQQPVSWMSEERRLAELFDLLELGKARITADQVNRKQYLTGIYMLPEKGIEPDFLNMLAQDQMEWYVPMMLQATSFADVMQTMVHNFDGSVHSVMRVDVRYLRGVIQLPISPEKRLVVSAEAVPYRATEPMGKSELYDDIMKMVSENEKK